MFLNNLIWRKRQRKKIISGKRQFSARAVVPLPFLYSSTLYLLKAIANPNFSAVTLFIVEFLWLLCLVSKSVTSRLPHFNSYFYKFFSDEDCKSNSCFDSAATESKYDNVEKRFLMKLIPLIFFPKIITLLNYNCPLRICSYLQN